MEAMNEEPRQGIEPQFLSQAQASGIKLHIGQMNKTEQVGTIRDIGRYEINVEENGKIVTLLKQEISYLSAPHPILLIPPPSGSADTTGRPNVQQEFLDKAIRENQLLTFFLINGQRIKATIEAYDNFTLLLQEGDKQHLYYKHSITTINR
jgi:host factor-I protein